MGEERGRGWSEAGAGEGACRRATDRQASSVPAARRHVQVPTECALCGAADFASVVEVGIGPSTVLHWVSPPAGWYLLREARPERGAPLLHARCPECLVRLFPVQSEEV